MSRNRRESRKESRRRRDEETAARLTREIASKAARRLDVLEWVILAGAGLAAIGGGALVAFLMRELSGWPFRLTWMVSALVLFVVPGAIALRRVRREEREWEERKKILRGQEPDV